MEISSCLPPPDPSSGGWDATVADQRRPAYDPTVCNHVTVLRLSSALTPTVAMLTCQCLPNVFTIFITLVWCLRSQAAINA